MSKATLLQWLERLQVLHPREMDLGLQRVASVAQALELLPVQRPVITVAGTNGKGSSVAVLESLLGAAGKRVGCFTSPHFLRFNERIRVAGEEAADADIIAAFEAIDAARGDTSLTYFEFATLAALLVFRDQQAEVLVLEVGLGGRLDSVNIVDPSVAVITRIDLDHQDWLGDDRGVIAVEKAGILRAGAPAVIGDADPPATLPEAAAEVAADPVLWLGRDFVYDYDEGAGELHAEFATPEGGRRKLSVSTPAALLPENVCTALQAAVIAGLDFSDRQAAQALTGTQAVGRRDEHVVAGMHYLLDVAHNPSAVDKLLEYIDARPCKGKTICLFSVMADKDIKAMLQASARHFDAWFLADLPRVERAASASEVGAQLHQLGVGMVSVSKNVTQAFRRAQSLMQEGDRLVVFGSFHTVAGVLPLLDKDRRKYS